MKNIQQEAWVPNLSSVETVSEIEDNMDAANRKLIDPLKMTRQHASYT